MNPTSHPWIASYPAGIRWDAPLPTGPIHGLLEDAAATWPTRPAIDFMGRRLSYAELLALSRQAAKGFQDLGVGPGVHVGLYLPNSPHYAIAFFGVLMAGGTVVNYSPLDAERVLEHKIEDSRTDVLVTLDLAALYPQMARLLGHTRLRTLVVGNLGDFAAQPAAVRAQLQAAGQLSAVRLDERTRSFANLLENNGQPQPVPFGDAQTTLAILQYTGGTTGLPKGAMLTHANVTSACSMFCATVGGEQPVVEFGTERLLAVLPLFHIYALLMNLVIAVRIGAEVILHTRFEGPAVLRDLVAKKVTVFAGVPTMYVGLLALPEFDQADLSALKFCNVGGAPLPEELNREWKRRTGLFLNEGWGMTETSPAGTFTPIVGERRSGSCGLPMPGVSIRMLDLSMPGRYVATGERGEMCIAGPNVMAGYWNSPQATTEAMTADGMLRTGDVAWMADDGFVYIVDRTKDMILCGGYNVYPRTVEQAIYEHPAVAECSVIGIHDDYNGQVPKAFVALKPGAPAFSLDELRAFLKDRLGKHEMVRALDIRAELPKTAVGKLSKKELHEEERAARQRAAAVGKAVP